MKKTIFALLLVVSVLLVAAAPAQFDLTRFTVINNSGDPVFIQLTNDEEGLNYYLTAPDGDESEFTVEKEVYDATVWACGGDEVATIDLLTQLRLNFPSCYALPFDTLNNHVIQGEASMEKVLLDEEYPDQTPFRFQY